MRDIPAIEKIVAHSHRIGELSPPRVASGYTVYGTTP
jgi:hypothetical protein